MDKLSPEKRSEVMSAVKGQNTTPEIQVRQALHAAGYRFRLHIKDLPGKPDIVLPKYRTCIFVHGCFWHQHPGCKRATIPETNRKSWKTKFEFNKKRDEYVTKELERLGWNVCVIWECQTKNHDVLLSELHRCLDNAG
jgi:DNA mismatch endonuclease (patch repair protein)